MNRLLSLTAIAFLLGGAFASAEAPYQSSSDFAKYAMKLRENALLNIEPKVFMPSNSQPLSFGRYPWKRNIVTTTFWVGESATDRNPVHNRSSSWDRDWKFSFGGFDNPDPSARRGYLPASFIPKQNPFYVALPYNDVTKGTTKPEARRVIPWFRDTFTKEGQSVCRDRWVAIRRGTRIAYAQWSDCGPFRTDHYQYVFGNDRPRPNLNQGAGLDVSPAVRDYLGMAPTDITDWKFVEFHEVPPGPWSRYGDNNTFVQNSRRTGQRLVKDSSESPKVITR